MQATYLPDTSFSLIGDNTEEFSSGRRLKCDCGVDGYSYTTVDYSYYTSPNTIVIVSEGTITDNLTAVLYGVIAAGDMGALPKHAHNDSEGQGGTISFNSLSDTENISTAKNFNELNDAPSSYTNTEGLFAQSTGSGIIWTAVSGGGSGTSNVQSFLDLTDTPSTYSGTTGKYARSTGTGIEWDALNYTVWPYDKQALPIINPSAETGDTTGWTNVVGAMAARTTGFEGSYYFYGGTSAITEAYQEITLISGSVTSELIDSGTAELILSFYTSGYSGDADSIKVGVVFYNSLDVALNTLTYGGEYNNDVWTFESVSYSIPETARYFRFYLYFTRYGGTDNNGYIDAIRAYIPVWATQFEDITDIPVPEANKYLKRKADNSGYEWAYSPPSGNWVLKNSFTYSNEAISESISWDGETDSYIRIVWIGFGSGASSNLKFNINNDTGSNYSYGAMIQDGGSGLFSTNTSTALSVGYIDRQVISITEGFLKNNTQPRVLSKNVYQYDSTNTDSFIIHVGSTWNNTSSNVTSLQFNSDTSTFTGDLKIYTWHDLTEADFSNTFIELTDTPATYSGSSGMVAQSTGSGIVFSPQPSWVDRGDPSDYDFILSDLTTDDNFHTLDLSTIVPTGTSMVKLIVLINGTSAPGRIHFRKNGNSNYHTSTGVRASTTGYTAEGMVDVFCDSNQIIEYSAENITWGYIRITVAGWYGILTI